MPCYRKKYFGLGHSPDGQQINSSGAAIYNYRELFFPENSMTAIFFVDNHSQINYYYVKGYIEHLFREGEENE